jgi:hypothetical protein
MLMTMLDDARNALRTGQRSEAARVLSRIIQREPTNGEAWYLLAEAVDDFQQQTYCMGMAARLGYSPAPLLVQPEPAPLVSPYVAASPPAQPVMPQIVIIDSRPREIEFSYRAELLRQSRIAPPLDYPRAGRRPLSSGEILLNVVLSVFGVALVALIGFLFIELVFPLMHR